MLEAAQLLLSASAHSILCGVIYLIHASVLLHRLYNVAEMKKWISDRWTPSRRIDSTNARDVKSERTRT